MKPAFIPTPNKLAKSRHFWPMRLPGRAGESAQGQQSSTGNAASDRAGSFKPTGTNIQKAKRAGKRRALGKEPRPSHRPRDRGSAASKQHLPTHLTGGHRTTGPHPVRKRQQSRGNRHCSACSSWGAADKVTTARKAWEERPDHTLLETEKGQGRAEVALAGAWATAGFLTLGPAGRG